MDNQIPVQTSPTNSLHLTPVPGCVFCEQEVLRYLDSVVFNRLEEDQYLIARIGNEHNIKVYPSEIKKHRNHLSTMEIDQDLLSQETALLAIPELASEKVIQSQINAIRLELARLNKLHRVSSPQYATLLSKLRELTELQSKLKGEMTEKSEVKITFDQLAKNLMSPAEYAAAENSSNKTS